MELILPEVLIEVRQLSIPVLITGLAVGLMLWLAGWWSHRFWVVLGATVIAGLFGLYEASNLHMQPLLAALLLAVAAGMLGLSLMRLLAFAAGGMTCLAVVHALVPSVHAPMVCFLSGGLVASLLFRLWMMVLTSFAGSVLLVYCGLGLAAPLVKINLIQWSEGNATILHVCCGVATLLGFVVQFLVDRKRKKRASAKKKKKTSDSSDKKSSPEESRESKILSWVPFRKAA